MSTRLGAWHSGSEHERAMSLPYGADMVIDASAQQSYDLVPPDRPGLLLSPQCWFQNSHEDEPWSTSLSLPRRERRAGQVRLPAHSHRVMKLGQGLRLLRFTQGVCPSSVWSPANQQMWSELLSEPLHGLWSSWHWLLSPFLNLKAITQPNSKVIFKRFNTQN